MRLLPTDPARRGRVILLLVVAVFLAPFVLGWLAYTFDWAPGRTANYGALIAPRALPDTLVQRIDGRALGLSALRGRWVLVHFDTAACDARCERKLYLMRQARRALGTDQARVERLWLLLDAATPAAPLLQAIEGTHVARTQGRLLQDLFAPQGDPTGSVYLVDPLGNLMMRFPREADPAKVIKDLKRLLKYSATG